MAVKKVSPTIQQQVAAAIAEAAVQAAARVAEAGVAAASELAKSQLVSLDNRTTIVENKLNGLEVLVKTGNEDTATILRLIETGKLGAALLKWLASIGAVVVAILTYLHLK